jgi:hypothetical protein
MVATTNQLPMIAATTPITIAIAIALHATRTLVWEVIEHRLENSPRQRSKHHHRQSAVAIGRCHPRVRTPTLIVYLGAWRSSVP